MHYSALMKRIFRSLFCVCLFLLILETGTRVLFSVKTINEVITKGRNDATCRWEWLKTHEGGAQIYDSFKKYDPTKGWAVIPNVTNGPFVYHKIINSNSKGLRGKVEYQYVKDVNKLRILCIGDSFTFGDEVNDNETYPFYLQEMLPQAEVINMGVEGYGHDQVLIYLKEEGIKYKPDIIILGFKYIDSDRDMLEFYDYAKPRFKLINNKLKLCNSPVPSPEMTLIREPWRSRFIDLLNIVKVEVSYKDGSYKKEKDNLTNALLKEIANTAKGIGAVPIIVDLDNLRDKDPASNLTKSERAFFVKCSSVTANCVFLRQNILAARQLGVKIKEEGHFDAETNQLVASGIRNYLQKNGFLERQ